MYDVFVAELRCPTCGQLAPTDALTAMQTHLRADADGAALAIGFAFDPRDLTTRSLLDSDYALISEPADGEPIRLLEVWLCPTGGTEEWALVTIASGVLASIEAVVLTRAVLARASFISETNAELLARALAGGDLGGRPPVDVLRARLP